MNTVTIVGRVGRDASEDYKAFDSGKTKARFSVAVNRWDSKTKEEVTDWYNVEVWDKQAEFAYNYVKKGRQVAIDGAIAGVKKDYLKPGDTRVLAASKMIGGGDKTSVRFPVAKIKGGGYDFFCSFLGHERKMHGKLIVE